MTLELSNQRKLINIRNIYARPDLAARVELNLSIEEAEALQFALAFALDELHAWKQTPDDLNDIRYITRGITILDGLQETLERALEGTGNGR